MSRLSPSALFEQRRHRVLNAVHTWLLAFGSLLLLAVTAWIFGGPVGLVAAIVFGAVSMAAVRRISPQMVLAMYKAQPVSRAQFPEGVAIVEELARRAGLPSAPRLFVVPSKLMNAFAVGRRDDSAIAITDALATRLTTREFDADLGAAMLTGDPDGLASALVKLERVQGRMWESLVLPGGRNPAPSVLRTHPPTAERVTRLMAFRDSDGRIPIAPAPGAQVVHRPSMVPQLRLPPGYRGGGIGASLVEAGGDLDHSRPARAVPLCAGEGDPRFRIRHGGVWW